MADQPPPDLQPTFALARLQRYQLTSFADKLSKPTESTDQNLNPEPIYTQEGVRAKERLIGCLPTDTKTFLFALVSIVYLIAGVMHFFGWTGDSSMLAYLLGTVGGYNGVTQVTSIFARKMKKEHDQESLSGK